MRQIAWLEINVKPLPENEMCLYPDDLARFLLGTSIKMHTYTGR